MILENSFFHQISLKKLWIFSALFLIVILIQVFLSSKFFEEKITQIDKNKIESKLSDKKDKIEKIINKPFIHVDLNDENKKISLIKEYQKENIGILLFEYGDIAFWSKSINAPLYSFYTFETSENVLLYKGNVYYFQKRKIPNTSYTIVGFVEIHQYYPVKNDLIESGINNIFNLNQKYEVQLKDLTQLPLSNLVLTPENQPLFGLKFIESNSFIKLISFCLFILSILFIFIIIHFTIIFLGKKGYYISSIILLLGLWVLIYFNVYQLKYFFNIAQYQFFSSEMYAMNNYLNSLGAMLIFLLFGMYIMHRLYITSKIHDYCKSHRYTFFLISFYLGFFWWLSHFITQSLVMDSSLSLDFYNQMSISWITVVCIFIIIISNVLVFYFLLFCYKIIGRSINIINSFYFLLLSIATYLSLGYFSDFKIYLLVVGSLVLIGISYFTYLLKRKYLSVYSFKRIVLFITFFAFFTNCILLQSNHEKLNFEMLVFAKNQLEDKDVILEYTMKNEIENIAQDNFIKTFFNNPYAISPNIVVEKIQKNYISSYLNPFECNIYLFDPLGYALETNRPVDYKNIEADFKKNNYDLDKDGIYTIKESMKGSKYYTVNNFYKDENELSGRMIIEIISKNTFSNSVYPELLMQRNNIKENITSLFNFGVYKNTNLKYNHGKYIYNEKENYLQKETYKFYFKDEYNHVKYSNESNDTIIVSVVKYTWFDVFSTYILWFTLFFVFVFIFYIVDILIKSYYSKLTIYDQLFHSFSIKLQFTTIFLVVFTIILLASISARFYIVQNAKKQFENINSKQNTISKVLQKEFVEVYADSLNNPDFINYKLQELQTKVKYLAEQNMVDINIYNIYGEYIVSSQNDIYTKGIVPNMIQPTAYNELLINNKSSYIENEKIGNLDYISVYRVLNNQLSNPIAIINIPYFDEKKESSKAVSQYLISMLSAYIVILVFAILLTYILSQQLTFSIRAIGNKLNKIKLQQTNERLQWEGEDEIGELVQEYNRLVEKLEESVKKLADNEREKAWREMAKQVAHEIKNPLTPMKLNLQYLQKAIHEDNPNVKELSKRFTSNLIEQIDLLTSIATQFSQFAQMPIAQAEKIFVNNVLISMTELHNNDENINCFYNNESDENVEVFMDKNYLIRVLTNIIKNGMQAIPEERMGVINLTLKKDETHAYIHIQDNGNGISEEAQDQIFLPHFSTKSSGMGIGLSMCKNIIENANGNISFQTEENIGTTFIIKLPLYNTSMN